MIVYIVIVHTEADKFIEVFNNEQFADAFISKLVVDGTYMGSRVVDHYFFEKKVRGRR